MKFRARLILWYWRVVHYLSVIRLRRRIVLGWALLGAPASLIITATIKPTFASRTIVRVESMNSHGYRTNDRAMDAAYERALASVTNGLSPQQIQALQHWRPGVDESY